MIVAACADALCRRIVAHEQGSPRALAVIDAGGVNAGNPLRQHGVCLLQVE